MAAPTLSVSDQLSQLDAARNLVLGDGNYYPQIIQGILPIIGPTARVELRRWGADFLAETFSNPTVSSSQKETLSLIVLENLKSMIENVNEDPAVVKSVVQTAASIYPFVLRWIINNPYDKPTWERMAAIKTRILRIWDTAAPGIRICCIKFSQRVVLAQTAPPDGDGRHGDSLDISLALVPPNHALIPQRNLEAEASGLLDRMLGVLHENPTDAVLIDATLNSLSILIRARPAIANKILHAILNFNPLKLANSPMTPKLRVMAKSMEKTTRILLMHVHKRDPQGPMALRIQQYVERLIRSRTEIFDEAHRKRGPAELVDGPDSAKRQKVGAAVAVPITNLVIPPFSPGPHTIAELFTITQDKGLIFDVAQIPEELVASIGVALMSQLDEGLLNQAIKGVRDRFESFGTQTAISQLNPDTAPLGVDEDDDDYEPDFEAAEDTEQILNKLDNAPPEESPDRPAVVALGPFKMPEPQALTSEEVMENGKNTVARVFSVMQTLEDPALKKNKAGINRLAASTYDREAWVTIVTRLATRAPAGLEDTAGIVKSEGGDTKVTLGDNIRDALYLYVLEDFRHRIETAVAWLCEEWYNDRIQEKAGAVTTSHYDKWVLRVLDGMMPYLDARDKVLTRFLGEIPRLTAEMLERVKGLCRDPAMVSLALTSLLYLVMMRPPVREIALDAVEDVWRTYDDAKPMAAKYLTKWRPGFIERNSDTKEDSETKLIAVSEGQNGVPLTA
ncbi:hypothetical protein V496_08775 [Pseudogymnoascus sp. VKM F-4515 (FW-2607)]|nr:hypothetical protein V496_08775 [Pseudogymnoascus sp. VKM F-4515 (FW-2607)]KFY90112.1 hypothetical protein V498_06162 [Pseudogymnoascus sp. VKM F-4517 (FW-2822)]